MISTTFSAVYGPVSSWRYGRSLGIDAIGNVSTCSFNYVYCQLGEIKTKTCDRAIYVSTQEILDNLQAFAPWDAGVKAKYMHLMQTIAPDEIQLNTPKRPKPLSHQLEGRENHTTVDASPYPVRLLKCVSLNALQDLANQIHETNGLFVRFATS